VQGKMLGTFAKDPPNCIPLFKQLQFRSEMTKMSFVSTIKDN